MSSGVLSTIKNNIEIIKIKQKRLEIKNKQIHSFGYDNAPDYYISEAESLVIEIEQLKEENYQLLDDLTIRIQDYFNVDNMIESIIVVDLKGKLVNYITFIALQKKIFFVAEEKKVFYTIKQYKPREKKDDVADEVFDEVVDEVFDEVEGKIVELGREEVLKELCNKLALDIISGNKHNVPIIIEQNDLEDILELNVISKLADLCIKDFNISEEDAEQLIKGNRNIVINDKQMTVSMKMFFIIVIYQLHHSNLLRDVKRFQKFVERHKHYMLVVSDQDIGLSPSTTLRIIGDDNENISPV